MRTGSMLVLQAMSNVGTIDLVSYLFEHKVMFDGVASAEGYWPDVWGIDRECRSEQEWR